METSLKNIVKAGQPVTREGLETIRKVWMDVYITLSIIRSPTRPALMKLLHDKLAECNEVVMNFFDEMGLE